MQSNGLTESFCKQNVILEDEYHSNLPPSNFQRVITIRTFQRGLTFELNRRKLMVIQRTSQKSYNKSI